jgi:hypothetical protein
MVMLAVGLDCYRPKPDFMPTDPRSYFLYVRAGEHAYTDPEKWEIIGRTFHPNLSQLADVERQGYCERKVRADAPRLPAVFYRT